MMHKLLGWQVKKLNQSTLKSFQPVYHFDLQHKYLNKVQSRIKVKIIDKEPQSSRVLVRQMANCFVIITTFMANSSTALSGSLAQLFKAWLS